jgi:hypothetical protein
VAHRMEQKFHERETVVSVLRIESQTIGVTWLNVFHSEN